CRSAAVHRGHSSGSRGLARPGPVDSAALATAHASHVLRIPQTPTGEGSSLMAAARVRMVPVTGVSLAVQLVGGGLSALTNLYLARHLGPGNQGALQVLVTVPAIVIVMGNLGVHVAGAWFV